MTTRLRSFVLPFVLLACVLVVGSPACRLRPVEPDRPAGVPKSAFWLGGFDGGVFVACGAPKPAHPTSYPVRIFYAHGEIWYEGTLRLDRPPAINEQDRSLFSGWDGESLTFAARRRERARRVLHGQRVRVQIDARAVKAVPTQRQPRRLYQQQHGIGDGHLRIPTGKVLNTIYCQALDASSTKDVTITVGEVQSRDDGGFGTITMLSMSSSGTPGHAKLVSSAWTGPRTIKTWDGTGPYTYYGYTITASLGDTSNLNIKSCAIDFF